MKYNQQLMETAVVYSRKSYCNRNKVGAVLAKDGRIISCGYNGTITGFENNCEGEIVICPNCGKRLSKDKCTKELNKLGSDTFYTLTCAACGESRVINESDITIKTTDFVLHAEQNAIMFCAKNGISTEGCDLFVTTSPCSTCAKLIAQAGIKKVIYLDEYKDTDGLDLLREVGVEVQKYKGLLFKWVDVRNPDL